MDTGTMHLTDEEKGMLRGERGEAVKEALAYQIAVGNFFKAEKFVPVANAHVMADIELIGDGGLEFLRRLKALGASCVWTPPPMRAAWTCNVPPAWGRTAKKWTRRRKSCACWKSCA